MKRLFFAFWIVLFLVTVSEASNENIGYGMGQKAIRGAVNICTGVVELPMQIYKGYQKGFSMIENNAGSKTVGTILGFFRGVGHGAGRISWGALELFGFWTANAPDNVGYGIPFDAEYAWQMGEQYDIFQPSLAVGLKPVGMKLVRGFSDGLLGILEIPGEAIVGQREGQLLKGIGKGFWFFLSREAYGFGSVYTCIVPNPPDNPGYPFRGQYPWSTLIAGPQA